MTTEATATPTTPTGTPAPGTNTPTPGANDAPKPASPDLRGAVRTPAPYHTLLVGEMVKPQRRREKWFTFSAPLRSFLQSLDELLRRAINNANYLYETWKQHPPDALIDNASIARTLWLMADMQSAEARQFWERMDRP